MEVWVKCLSPQITYRHLNETTGAEWRHFMVFFCCFFTFEEVVTITFNCLGFGCDAVHPWDSKSVFWTQPLHPPFHRRRGEYIMSEFIFFCELSLYTPLQVSWVAVFFYLLGKKLYLSLLQSLASPVSSTPPPSRFYFFCQNRQRFGYSADLPLGANRTPWPLLPMLHRLPRQVLATRERGASTLALLTWQRNTGTEGKGRVGGLDRPGSTILPICCFKARNSRPAYKCKLSVICIHLLAVCNVPVTENEIIDVEDGRLEKTHTLY